MPETISSIILVQEKYNYVAKFKKACENGNIKYIEKLIKKGKATVYKV